MSYDERLAERVRSCLGLACTEKKMFGGLGFLLNGNMAVGVSSAGELMVRVDPEDFDELVAAPAARPFEMSGRSMRGWLLVDPAVDDAVLEEWVARGVDYAATLPRK